MKGEKGEKKSQRKLRDTGVNKLSFDMNNRTIFPITQEPTINSKYRITEDNQNM